MTSQEDREKHERRLANRRARLKRQRAEAKTGKGQAFLQLAEQAKDVSEEIGDDEKAPVVAETERRAKVRLSKRITAFLDGEFSVEDLTVEELVRGQMRGADGVFHRPPKLVPREFHQACMRELLRRGDELFQRHYIVAIQAMADIASDPGMEPKDRLKASQYIIERVAGKTPERLEVSVADPWQEALDEIVVVGSEDQAIERAKEALRDNAPSDD